jgi:hypothetical protein
MSEISHVATLPRARDPQYREIYSNQSQTTLGAFDISLLFQRISEIEPGKQGNTDQVLVTLSPQHFKALVRSLNETLKAYETAFGALTISDTESAPSRSAEEMIGLVETARAGSKSRSSSKSKD